MPADLHTHRLFYPSLGHVALSRAPQIVEHKARIASFVHSILPRPAKNLDVIARLASFPAVTDHGAEGARGAPDERRAR